MIVTGVIKFPSKSLPEASPVARNYQSCQICDIIPIMYTECRTQSHFMLILYIRKPHSNNIMTRNPILLYGINIQRR